MNRLNNLLFISVAFTALLCSCSKEPTPVQTNGIQQERHRAVCRIAMEPGYEITTKSGTGTIENDDFIDRIDMFEFDSDGNNIQHRVWADPSGLDLTTIHSESYGAAGEQHNWVFLANLTEDTAEYLAGLDADEIGRAPEGIIPLEAGNFRMHKPIMAGTARSYFEKDETINVTLYRYLTRIDIENITANFTDEDIMSKDVKLNRIAIINYPNALRILTESAREVWGRPQSVWGKGYTKTSDPAFGNLLKMDTNCNDLNLTDFSGSFNQTEYGGNGTLAEEYKHLLNYNKGAEKWMLNISATGDQLSSSVHTFHSGEGILCSSEDEGLSHTIELNRTLYTVPLVRNSYTPLWCDKDKQDDVQKLVLEITIEGIPNYYIISLRELNAGRIYTVKNITINGYGSEYPNFYEKRYDAEISGFEIEGWTMTEIDNIDVGYTSDGTSIY